MRRKISSFINSKIILLFLCALCMIFIVVSFFSDRMSTPLKNAVSRIVIPAQKGMNYIGVMVSDRYDTIQEIRSVLEKNQELQATVDSLTEENNQLKQDSYELNRLRQLYELDEKYPGYEKVAARVIGTTSDNWYSTFTIDKGTNDGMETDMNVISGGGLVGIITETGKNYSIVKTVIEDNSFVSGMMIDTGDTCIVQGNISLMDNGLIELNKIKSGVTVRNGDKIVTSNISDKYLPGILIGYTKDVKMDSNNLTQSGYLVPAVDFAHIQEVLVIKQKKIIE